MEEKKQFFIIDIDGTLVDTITKIPRNKLSLSVLDYKIIDYNVEGKKYRNWVMIRPGAFSLVNLLNKHKYPYYIWTMGSRQYALNIVKILNMKPIGIYSCEDSYKVDGNLYKTTIKLPFSYKYIIIDDNRNVWKLSNGDTLFVVNKWKYNEVKDRTLFYIMAWINNGMDTDTNPFTLQLTPRDISSSL